MYTKPMTPEDFKEWEEMMGEPSEETLKELKELTKKENRNLTFPVIKVS